MTYESIQEARNYLRRYPEKPLPKVAELNMVAVLDRVKRDGKRIAEMRLKDLEVALG